MSQSATTTEATSFSETADIETSSDAYSSRFSGQIGKWFLAIQEKIVLSLLKHNDSTSVLEVGGGHGQLAYAICKNGFKLTILGSDISCSTRISKLISENLCSFQVGDLVNLPYSDKTFDAVISVRLIPHCKQWKKLISELCRVSKNQVIIDYPPLRSFNIMYRFLFSLKLKAEGNTREFSIFSDAEIEGAFLESGFTLERRRPQFFLPMVIYRRLKIALLASILESFFRLSGLTYIFGSPTISAFVRKIEK